MEMYRFKTKNFTVIWEIFPDDDVDTSFDETGETDEKLESGEWQAFVSKVYIEYRDAEICNDYLCGSIYSDPANFRDHIGAQGKYGSYFSDMVSNCVREAREWVRENTVYIRTNA